MCTSTYNVCICTCCHCLDIVSQTTSFEDSVLKELAATSYTAVEASQFAWPPNETGSTKYYFFLPDNVSAEVFLNLLDARVVLAIGNTCSIENVWRATVRYVAISHCTCLHVLQVNVFLACMRHIQILHCCCSIVY